jgi:hypothetical protein
MKKLIASIVLSTAFLTQAAFPIAAAESTNAPAKPPAALDLLKGAKPDLWNKVDVDAYGAVSYTGIGKGPGVLSSGIGLTYWLTPNFGGGLRTETANWLHSSVDRTGIRLATRGRFGFLVPYGFIEAWFSHEAEEYHEYDYAYIRRVVILSETPKDDRYIVAAGGGLQYNIIKNAGVYIEGSLESTISGDAGSKGVFGLRFSF